MGLLDDAIREHLELKRKHGAAEEEIARAEREALTPARRDPSAGAGLPPVEYVDGEAVEPSLADEPPPMQPPATDKPPPPDLSADPVTEVVDRPTAIRPVPPVEDDLDLDPDAPPPPARPAVAYDDDEEDDYLAPEPVFEPELEPEPAATADDGPAAHPPLESTEPIEAPELEQFHAGGEGAATAPDPAFDDEYEPDEVPSDEALGDPYRAQTSILDDPLGDEPPPPARPPAPAAPEEEPAADGEQDVLEETPDFLQETPEHDKLWFEQKPPRDFDFD